MDAQATCQGPCGRRICDRHAVPEGSSTGLQAVTEPVVSYDVPLLNRVVALGYASGRGVRCPDCRNADAGMAHQGIPRAPATAPVARLIWERRHYGVSPIQRLPPGWGKEWVHKAKSLGIGPGDWNGSGWSNDSVEIGDRPVYRFMYHDTGQVSYGTVYEGGWSPRLILDAETGCVPRYEVTRRKRFLVPSRVETRLVSTTGNELGCDDALNSLGGTPPYPLRDPAKDRSWQGSDPSHIYEWLTSDAGRSPLTDP
jgi:hypothetical protein